MQCLLDFLKNMDYDTWCVLHIDIFLARDLFYTVCEIHYLYFGL